MKYTIENRTDLYQDYGKRNQTTWLAWLLFVQIWR